MPWKCFHILRSPVSGNLVNWDLKCFSWVVWSGIWVKAILLILDHSLIIPISSEAVKFRFTERGHEESNTRQSNWKSWALTVAPLAGKCPVGALSGLLLKWWCLRKTQIFVTRCRDHPSSPFALFLDHFPWQLEVETTGFLWPHIYYPFYLFRFVLFRAEGSVMMRSPV